MPSRSVITVPLQRYFSTEPRLARRDEIEGFYDTVSGSGPLFGAIYFPQPWQYFPNIRANVAEERGVLHRCSSISFVY